jgi:hypothetical protein
MVRFTWLLGLVVLLVGCGGRVGIEDDGVGGDTSEKPGESGESGGAGTSPFSDSETTPLGECELGETVGAADTCPWKVDQRCYLTRDAACACACPHDKERVICTSSDFDGDDGRVVVGCD